MAAQPSQYRAWIAAIAGVIAIAGSSLLCAPGATAAPTKSSASSSSVIDVASIRANLITSLQADVDALSKQSSPSDPRYFAAGVWQNGLSGCFRCMTGPGVAAAALSRVTGDATDLQLAQQTFDTAIANHEMSNGAFGPPGTGETGPDIQTVMFANQLGEAYLLLRPKLTASERSTWSSAMAGAANFLVTNGNLHWYTNGNISLANALDMLLAYDVTGEAAFRTDFTQALSFVEAPPEDRWPGDGLQFSTTPTAADGSDGAGYFAETGSGGTGYDADYTQVQLDVASWIAMLDPADGIKLVNLLLNQEWPRVNTSAWTLNTSGGTRHPQADRYVGFLSSGLTVAALQGGRSDLAQWVGPQLAATEQSFAGATTYSDNGMYYNFATEATPALVSLSLAMPASPTRPVTTPSPPTSLTPSRPTLAAVAVTIDTVTGPVRALQVRGVLHHGTSGARVQLQRQTNRGWVQIASSIVDASGTYSFGRHRCTHSLHHIRVYLPAQNGWHARVSKTRKLRIR